jgi:hypothetical protein
LDSKIIDSLVIFCVNSSGIPKEDFLPFPRKFYFSITKKQNVENFEKFPN